MDLSEHGSIENGKQEAVNLELPDSSLPQVSYSSPNQNWLSRAQSLEDDDDDSCAFWDGALDAWQPEGDIIESLPPQLHPAVSLGMRRVSSCYFSIHSGSEATNSVADLLSLLEEEQGRQSSSAEKLDSESSQTSARLSASDVLYHDVLMHTMTFLNSSDLAAFSETGRRPNFECFYFLQLQLQRALLVSSPDVSVNNDDDTLDAGVLFLTRLATLDEPAARALVDEYTNSNSTLTRMPLSHSLAYIRHVLRRNGFHQHVTDGSPAHALAGAALVITLVGATSVMTGSTSPEVVLPNVLKVGLAGSVLGAARDAACRSDGHSMRDTAEQMARMMSEFPQQLRRQMTTEGSQSVRGESDNNMMRFPTTIAARMYAAMLQAYGSCVEDTLIRDSGDAPQRREKRSRQGPSKVGDRVKGATHSQNTVVVPMTPNPYEHLPPSPSSDEMETEVSKVSPRIDDKHVTRSPRKMPSGCVGAHARVINHAALRVRSLLKERRKQNFMAMPDDERRAMGIAFIEACASDDTLSVVKDIVQTRECIDVDGSFQGLDGITTCALNTASFQGACRVLEFLCKGMDESPAHDGGLCDVNRKDTNGWTALHFAAGANSVEAVKILARYGSDLTVEAANGYTPLEWARRLSSKEAAEELERLGADHPFLGEMSGWTQPLSVIASRFFALIPTS